jgi:hypothetical protein
MAPCNWFAGAATGASAATESSLLAAVAVPDRPFLLLLVVVALLLLLLLLPRVLLLRAYARVAAFDDDNRGGAACVSDAKAMHTSATVDRSWTMITVVTVGWCEMARLTLLLTRVAAKLEESWWHGWDRWRLCSL